MPKQGPTSEFWVRLIAARTEAKLPVRQIDIAKEAHVYQSAVQKWKSGEAKPTLDVGTELAMSSGVCVDWLYTGRGPKHPGDGLPMDPGLAKLIDRWNHLTPESRLDLLKHAAYLRTTQDTTDMERILEYEKQLQTASKGMRVHEKRETYRSK